MLKPAVFSLAIVAGGGVAMLANAAEFYRYVNDKGVTVIDRLGVPPEYIEKGYQVVDDQGRVIRSVPKAPTLEERRQMAEEKARAKSDIQLLRIYSEPQDVDRARDRKLAELDGVIGVAYGNLNSLRTQQANLQSRAAEIERSGSQVPEHLLVQIDNLKAEQAGVEKDIQRYKQTRADAAASFAADRARLVELRGE
jgi:hypothetical protein